MSDRPKMQAFVSMDEASQLHERIVALKAERDRYRDALEKVIHHWDSDDESMAGDPAEIARIALGREYGQTQN